MGSAGWLLLLLLALVAFLLITGRFDPTLNAVLGKAGSKGPVVKKG